MMVFIQLQSQNPPVLLTLNVTSGHRQKADYDHTSVGIKWFGREHGDVLVRGLYLDGLYTSMSSSSLDPKLSLGCVLAKTFRTLPSSEPRNITVRSL